MSKPIFGRSKSASSLLRSERTPSTGMTFKQIKKTMKKKDYAEAKVCAPNHCAAGPKLDQRN